MQAAINFSEIFINPPGTDNGQEFIELRSTTGGVESMANVWLIGVEGDQGAIGVVDIAIDLGAFSTGTNGLFLRRDSATVLQPAPDPATVVSVADFLPDIENGTQTFFLVTNFTGAVGNDLDTNDLASDGLTNTPWTTVLDVTGITENDSGANESYAAFYGGFAFPAQAGASPFNPDAIFRSGGDGQWVAADVSGASPGPYTTNSASETVALQNGGTFTEVYNLTPGSVNPVVTPVPEPTALALTAFGFALLWRRRSN